MELVNRLRNMESEPQNRRISKGGFALLSPFYKKDRIPQIFNLQSSIFDLQFKLLKWHGLPLPIESLKNPGNFQF